MRDREMDVLGVLILVLGMGYISAIVNQMRLNDLMIDNLQQRVNLMQQAVERSHPSQRCV